MERPVARWESHPLEIADFPDARRFRLSHPNEFVHTYKIGREQLGIFVVTLVSDIATDLLIGITIGIETKFAIHINNGVPIRALFRPYLDIAGTDETTYTIIARQSAIFSNWFPFKRQIENLGLVQRKHVIIDLTNATLVDHSVMEKLNEMQLEFQQEGLPRSSSRDSMSTSSYPGILSQRASADSRRSSELQLSPLRRWSNTW